MNQPQETQGVIYTVIYIYKKKRKSLKPVQIQEKGYVGQF